MSGSSNGRYLGVYVLTIAVVAIPIVIFLAPSPRDQTGIAFTLRMSAWLAFLIYVLIFCTRPLRQIIPIPFTRLLLRLRPFLGLIFGAIMTVHLGVIAWLFAFVLGTWPPMLTLAVGGTAYVLMFLMLVTTFERPARFAGSQNWRRLHKAGIYWIGAVFAATLIPDVYTKPTNPVYLVIGLLMVFAVALRSMAYLRREDQSTAAIDSER